MSEPIRVFISYSREDLEKAMQLYYQLRAAGFQPWIDKKDILPGEIWEQSIWRAVRQAHFVVICLSSGSVQKRGFLQREIKTALSFWQEKLDKDIYLIPVRFDECEVPQSLAELQWVDLFKQDGFEQLLAALTEGVRRYGFAIRPMTGSVQIRNEQILDDREERPRFHIDIAYPQFESSIDRNIAEANTVLKATVLQEVHAFRRLIFDTYLNSPENVESTGSDFIGGYNVELLNECLISVSYPLSSYTSGAAHPNNWVKVCNLYLNPVVSITLDELFDWESDFVTIVSEYCDKNLKEQSRQRELDDEMSVGLDSFIYSLQEGGIASRDDFSCFTITEHGLNFIFVGPHVLGMWEVTVPFNVLQNSFQATSLIQKLLHRP